VAALMSALLGTHWPVNSVGVLPDVDPLKDGYLSMRGGEREIAESVVVNAKVNLSRCYIGYVANTELGHTGTLSCEAW
jgi:GPI ethanolamine phosphate transferase 1